MSEIDLFESDNTNVVKQNNFKSLTKIAPWQYVLLSDTRN